MNTQTPETDTVSAGMAFDASDVAQAAKLRDLARKLELERNEARVDAAVMREAIMIHGKGFVSCRRCGRETKCSDDDIMLVLDTNGGHELLDENARLEIVAAEGAQRVQQLLAEVERLRKRLVIDPGGSDLIDELQSSNSLLQTELTTLRRKVDAANEMSHILEAEENDYLGHDEFVSRFGFSHLYMPKVRKEAIDKWREANK